MLPVSLFIVAVVFVIAWLSTRRTALGTFTEAVGINARSSFYAGIDEKRVKLVAYTFCGLCAGIAGLVASSTIRTSDANNIGRDFELDAILAVVIGGTALGAGGRFSLFASIVGALVIQAITTSMYAVGRPGQRPARDQGLRGHPRHPAVLGPGARLGPRPHHPPERRGVMERIRGRLGRYRRFAPVAVTMTLFFLAYAYGALAYDAMRDPQVFLNMLRAMPFLLISAIGMTFVIVSGGIDLSVGGVVALTTVASPRCCGATAWIRGS